MLSRFSNLPERQKSQNFIESSSFFRCFKQLILFHGVT
ncbi:hypothetical protein BB65665_06706 [Bacillus sp. 916]|nr:hypothetical protein U471_24020 [Bacillus amyloliquefaciens CC178]EJD68451.1 hypothetical protein BB65665_06706 [Bacillus sp. 916]QEY91164.1 hypothetical protein BACIT_3333 [Bacillus amyloliquefaciens]QEY94093.1 hypothetical protein BACIH_2382 [Bacillus amyloliquefaciens]RAP20037.1 hypothetical protein C2W63_01768 [Bacillus velezensis]